MDLIISFGVGLIVGWNFLAQPALGRNYGSCLSVGCILVLCWL